MQKIPDPIDRHVGARVRMRRILAGMSQVQLGSALGVTYQQMQKYEKGTNRISVSRLQQIGYVLGVPASSFFVDHPAVYKPTLGQIDAAELIDLETFLSTREGAQLAIAFSRITNAPARRRIVNLIEALGEEANA